MKAPFFLLDTFTTEKFRGNPTPVCLLDLFPVDQLLHQIALEFNAPVTAFLRALGDRRYAIRYFSVTGEIPACGHATLGAATVLFRELKGERLTMITQESVQLEARQQSGRVAISYPRFGWSDMLIPAQTIEALGVRNTIGQLYSRELQTLFIELSDESEVVTAQPDFRLLEKSSTMIKEVVIMSAASGNSYDIVLRSFCPWIGIDEDPVTGSIHAVLGPYWKEKLGKDSIEVYQASARGGFIHVTVLPDLVEIGGDCQWILEGQISV